MPVPLQAKQIGSCHDHGFGVTGLPAQPQERRAADRARRACDGEARGSQGRHQPGDLAALAAPRARLARHRPRGSSLPEVQATLGHGNISTTSGYLHAKPDSGLDAVVAFNGLLRSRRLRAALAVVDNPGAPTAARALHQGRRLGVRGRPPRSLWNNGSLINRSGYLAFADPATSAHAKPASSRAAVVQLEFSIDRRCAGPM